MTGFPARAIASTALALCFLFLAPPAIADSHLDRSAAFIRNLANASLETIKDDKLAPEARSEEFRTLFREGFAVVGIARFVTGRYWRGATQAEREEYLVLFEDVIVNEWSDRLFSQYNGQRFEVRGAIDATPENSPEDVALVESELFTDETTALAIEWRVARKGDLMKITDVKVDGFSLAKTQQDDFVAHISKNGRKFSSLIEKLREKRGP